MCCWHFGLRVPSSFSWFVLLLQNLVQIPVFSMLTIFTVSSSQPAFADFLGSMRLLSHSSLLGHISTAVQAQPVNLRLITHSGLQANLSCSLYYLFLLGFGICFTFAAAFICWMLFCQVSLLLTCFSSSCSTTWCSCQSNHLLCPQAPGLAVFPGASSYTAIACLSWISVTCRTRIWLHFSVFSTTTCWLS